MAGFRCPFCGQIMSVNSSTFRRIELTFNGAICRAGFTYDVVPHLAVDIYRCPDSTCGKETVIVAGQEGYIDNTCVNVYPESTAIIFPEYVPKAIRKDYEEACAILRKSPKASATLSRRCLQGMIRDFWGIKKNRLVDEINELQGKVPPAQWAAIDALRTIGNIGAHMEKDVNLVVDVEPGEAEQLIRLIELLIDKWYINRHEEEELYKSITDAASSK